MKYDLKQWFVILDPRDQFNPPECREQCLGGDRGDNECLTTPIKGKTELKAKLALLKKRCEYCDGTGLVHGLDGELRGVCTQCDASKQILEL